MKEKFPITIIGGGAVGCAVAYELSVNQGIEDIVLLEKNGRLGEEQSGRSAEVIHSGLYYSKGTSKSKLCPRAVPYLYEFCEKYDVPNIRTGKMIVATNREEINSLAIPFQRGIRNGVQVQRMTENQIKKLEPNVHALEAVYSPNTGIINASEYVNKLASLSKNAGTHILNNSEVIEIDSGKDDFTLTYKRGKKDNKNVESFKSEILINCAGLNSLDIAKKINPDAHKTLVPGKILEKGYLKGEFYEFNRKKRPELDVRMNIYPAPKEIKTDSGIFYDFGIHLTPTVEFDHNYRHVQGRMIRVGPYIQPMDLKVDYTHNENKEPFLKTTQSFFPQLQHKDLVTSYVGILGVLKNHFDFVIRSDPKYENCIQLVDIESPGLTCSLEIAKKVASMI